MFSNIIKYADGHNPSVRSYTMRVMPIRGDVKKEKGFPAGDSSRHLAGSAKGIEQLRNKIEERENYIKKIKHNTDNVEKKAYEKGFAQGEKAGKELGEKKFDSVIRSFSEGIDELKRLKKELYQRSEQEMVTLVLAIARKVVQREVNIDKSIIAPILQNALTYIVDHEEIKVKLNPSDLDFARERFKETEGIRNVLFEGDEKVSRGSVIVESDRSVIDGGVEHHLCKLEKLFVTQLQQCPQDEEETAG